MKYIRMVAVKSLWRRQMGVRPLSYLKRAS
jgi:hypothetical protein